jgi:hypothetical protein
VKTKVVFLSIILLLCIAFIVYYGIVIKKPHSLTIIGGADGPTVMYVNGINDTLELVFYENDIKIITNGEFYENDIKIITNDENIYEFEIINNEKINLLMENKYVALLFILDGIKITAKSHPAHSSSAYPNVDSDYYFLADEKGKPLFLYGNFKIITLHKIDKTFISPKIEFDINKIETKERN